MGEMINEFKRAIIIFGVMAIVLGIIYPLLITGISQVAFPYQANGEMVKINGNIVGSELIGQSFEGPQYFQGRPSATDYNASTSGGSNYGPTNQKLVDRVNETISEIRTNDSLPSNAIYHQIWYLHQEVDLTDISVLNLHISRFQELRRQETLANQLLTI